MIVRAIERAYRSAAIQQPQQRGELPWVSLSLRASRPRPRLTFACALLSRQPARMGTTTIKCCRTGKSSLCTGRSITEWGNAWWRFGFDNPDFLTDTTGEFSHLGNVARPGLLRSGVGRRAQPRQSRRAARRAPIVAHRDVHLDVLRSVRRDPLRAHDHQREFHQGRHSRRVPEDRRRRARAEPGVASRLRCDRHNPAGIPASTRARSRGGRLRWNTAGVAGWLFG